MAKQGRKPVHLSMQGGKDNRQRLWEALRENRDGFTWYGLSRTAGVTDETANTYLRALHKSGYIAPLPEARDTAGDRCFHLLRDVGAEAPRLKSDGTPSLQGLGTEAMWRTLRVLGELDAKQLAEHASIAAETSVATAKNYLKWLKWAGYVQEVVPSRPGRLARYRLAPGKYTGPRPPMIQKCGQLYDANLEQVVYRRTRETEGEPA
ncbi:hypothetical protein D3C78_744090 [compost metagenome]